MTEDSMIERLGQDLSPESEQKLSKLPALSKILTDLQGKAPGFVTTMLLQFKEQSWKALNSFVHAGIHPVKRMETGFPVQLIEQLIRNSNGLALMAANQCAFLLGGKDAVKEVRATQKRHLGCFQVRF